MRRELAPQTRTLHELRTIQYLEEKVGPPGLRRLADALVDPELRSLVLSLRRRSAAASLELESILEDWAEAVEGPRRQPHRLPEGGLDANEIVESFLEVKRDSAEILRRASDTAPSPALTERLRALAQEEDAAVENLDILRRKLAQNART